MDRQTIARACHDVGFTNRFKEAQGLFLSGPNVVLAAPGNFTITSTAQRALLLETLNIEAASAGVNSFGTISAINIAGQSAMTSNQVCGISMFRSTSFCSGSRALGISVDNNMQVTVIGNITSPASNVSVAIGCQPIPSDTVKTRSEQATAYNYVHGLGSVVCAGGATTTVTSVSQRAVTLGSIVMELGSAGNIDDLYVTSFRISNLEQLAGAAGQQQVPLAAFLENASMCKDLTLGICIRPQAQIDIDIQNIGGPAVTVQGGIFCLPWSGESAVLTARNQKSSGSPQRLFNVK